MSDPTTPSAWQQNTGVETYDVARWLQPPPTVLGPQSSASGCRALVQRGHTTGNATQEVLVPEGDSVLLLFLENNPGTDVTVEVGGDRLRFGPADHGWVSIPVFTEQRWICRPNNDNTVHLHVPFGLVRRFAPIDVRELIASGTTASDDLVGTIFQRLGRTLMTEPALSSLELESWTTIILGGVARAAGARRTSEYGACDWRIRRSIEEIEARLHEDLGLIELAAAVGLSPSHYAMLFRAATGMPPHAWLVKRRIGRACELLMNPRISITDIAFTLGFPSSQHFATTFRKHIGATPSEWRRRRMM